MEEWLDSFLKNIGLKEKTVHDYPEMIEGFKDAMDFTRNYYNSPRFIELLNNHAGDLSIEYNNKYNPNYNPDIVYGVDIPRVDFTVQLNKTDKGSYSNENNIYINPKEYYLNTNYDDIGFSGNSIMAHEIRHVLQDKLKPQPWVSYNLINPETLEYEWTPNQNELWIGDDYTGTYPIFKNNRQWQKIYWNSDNKMREYMDKDPSFTMRAMYDIAHDANPIESDSDLFALRYELNRLGIYDSMKAGVPITKEQVLEYYKINPNFRLFKLFPNIDDIVTMLNTVADNGQQNNQYNTISYAKRGIKLIPRKRKFI